MKRTTTPRRGGVLREGYDYDFSRCDPTGAHVDPAWCAIYETVTVSGPDGELGPMLAESWRQDPDRERRLALPDPAGRALPVRRAVRRDGRRRRRSASTAIRSRRRSTRSSGGTSPACGPRATRCSSSCTSRAPACRGCCAPGTRRSTTRPPAERPATTFGRTTADGTGPVRLRRVRRRARTSTSRRWEGYRGPHTTWQENARPRLPRRDALDSDPRRPRARRRARARRDRLPPERLAARRRPARARTRSSR